MATKEKAVDLTSEYLKEKFTELEEKKPPEVKKRTINLGFFNLEESILKDEREERIGEINITNTIYTYEVIYDEGRDKFRAAYTVQGRKQSLSFFNNRLQAYKAVLITICSLVGVNIKDINVSLS